METATEKNIDETKIPGADKPVVIIIDDFTEAHILQLIDGAIS